ncbi:MAG: hypothetical protein V1765_02125 [bacterium]
MSQPKYNLHNNEGFDIIEILIMISLVTLVFVAIMSLVTKNIQLENLSKNDYAAISLVKEGLDLAEEIRNDNIIRLDPFFKDLTCDNPPLCTDTPEENWTCSFRLDYADNRSQLVFSRECYDPTSPPDPIPNVSDAEYALQFDDNNYYQYSSGAVTPFHRLITTVYHVGGISGPYLDVKSEVYWEYKGQGYVYDLNTKLFNEN